MLIAFISKSYLNSQFTVYAWSISCGCLLLSVFSYFGTLQRHIYRDSEVLPYPHPAIKQVIKYERSQLSEEDIRDIYLRLTSCFDTRHPYLDSELTLSRLADMVEVPHRALSQVINQKGGTNFFDFINSYRIEHAKGRLRAGDYGTILDLAMDVGFNSKSAFYEAFKKHVKCTPSAFRARQVELKNAS